MKRTLTALAVPLACVLTLTRCSDVLETKPMGELNTQTFYKTPKDFEAATLGVYSTLLNYSWDGGGGTGYFNAILKPDDDTRAAGNHVGNDFQWTSNYRDFAVLWAEWYKGVARANMVIDQLQSATLLTDQQKGRFAGEAKFMRAYFYFLLARHFGNVPVVTAMPTRLEETRPGNSAAGEVWDLIEKDLEEAAAALPERYDAANRGRATRWAALALLGKAEIYRAQWLNQPAKYNEAIAHLDEVVQKGGFQLVPFADNFRYETENNAESVFEVQASGGDSQNGWGAVDVGGSAGIGRQINWGAACGPSGECAPGYMAYGYGRTHITPSLQAAFEAGDPRKYFTFYSPGEIYGTPDTAPYRSSWSLTGATPAKYLRPFYTAPSAALLNASVSKNNERVIRYSDVLLLLAEAYVLGPGNVGRAAELVNRVRQRARSAYGAAYGASSRDAALYASKGIATPPADLLPPVPAAGTPRQWFKEYLVPERRVELALEGNRFDDLVRWLRAGLINRSDIDFGDDLANRSFDPQKHLLKPIPQGELDMNPNLRQNPGY